MVKKHLANKWPYEYKVIIYHNVIKSFKSASETVWHHYEYVSFCKCFSKNKIYAVFPPKVAVVSH